MRPARDVQSPNDRLTVEARCQSATGQEQGAGPNGRQHATSCRDMQVWSAVGTCTQLPWHTYSKERCAARAGGETTLYDKRLHMEARVCTFMQDQPQPGGGFRRALAGVARKQIGAERHVVSPAAQNTGARYANTRLHMRLDLLSVPGK